MILGFPRRTEVVDQGIKLLITEAFLKVYEKKKTTRLELKKNLLNVVYFKC